MDSTQTGYYAQYNKLKWATPIFMEKSFTDGIRSAKFAKVFSLESSRYTVQQLSLGPRALQSSGKSLFLSLLQVVNVLPAQAFYYRVVGYYASQISTSWTFWGQRIEVFLRIDTTSVSSWEG